MNMKYLTVYIKFSIVNALFLLAQCGGAVDFYETLSGDYLYTRGDGDHILDTRPNGKNIYGKIVKYKFDKDFIVALQQPNHESYKTMIAFNLRTNYSSDEEVNLLEMKADSILAHSPYYIKIFSRKKNYWIISHKNRQIYGPYSIAEYLTKKEELKIPSNLNLNKIDNY